jgi:hypothetical protein
MQYNGWRIHYQNSEMWEPCQSMDAISKRKQTFKHWTAYFCKTCLVWQSLICRTVRYFYYICYTFNTIFCNLIFYYLCYMFNSIFCNLIFLVSDIFLNYFIFCKFLRSLKEDCKTCLLRQRFRIVRYLYYTCYTFNTIFYHLIFLVSDIFLNHFILSKVFRGLQRLSGDV